MRRIYAFLGEIHVASLFYDTSADHWHIIYRPAISNEVTQVGRKTLDEAKEAVRALLPTCGQYIQFTEE